MNAYCDVPRRNGHRLLRLLLPLLALFVGTCAITAAAGADGTGVWTKLTPGYDVYYKGVDFIDNQKGWLVGDERTILRTTDGGATWTRQHYVADAYALHKIHMVDQNRGWAVGNGGAIYFYNGLGWTQQTSPAGGPLEDVCFTGYSEGWIVGSSSKILHTTTGGADPDGGGPLDGWSLANTGVPTDYDKDIWFNGVAFSGTTWGWAVGEDYYPQSTGSYWASAYCTTNGGQNWYSVLPHRTFIPGRFYDVEFFPPSGLWACGEDTSKPYGERGMIWHTDNPVGTSGWTRQTLPSGTDDLRAIHFATAGLGWAVGDDEILVTTNGGGTWTKEASPETYLGILNDVDSVDGETAWAAGFGDRVMKRSPDGVPPVTTATGVPSGWVPRSVTVGFTANDSGSGVDYTEYRCGSGWNRGRSTTISTQGDNLLEYRSVDKAGNVEATRTAHVKVDTRKPTPKAPYKASVRRGRTVTLRCKIVDPRPGGPTATVTIRVKTLGGTTVYKKTLKDRAVNVLLSHKFRCRLAKKTYRFYVYAKDTAGNTQTKAARNTLRVR